MTQLPEQGAVGEASAPIDNAFGTDTLDHAAAAFDGLAELPDAPLDPNNPDEPQGDEPEGDEPEEPEQQDEPEQPAIDPPVSWKAEDKEAFKSLPPEVQKTIADRETERERFVQAKSQEAASTRVAVENEARAVIAQQQQQMAQELQQYASLIQPQEPDASQYPDWQTYSYAKSQFDAAVAQRSQAQRQAEQYAAQAQAQQQHIAQAEQQAEVAKLRTEFPEWFEPGANHQQALTAIARDMGYSEEHVTQARAVDILAMRRAAVWKEGYDKLQALNKSKMETVREAKKLGPVTRPGVAQPAGSGKVRAYQESMGRLRETGSIADAANALARL